jgi:hypothetical protein
VTYFMHGKGPDIEQMMWDIYNAHGSNGGQDVTEAVRHFSISDAAKKHIIDTIKIRPFMTPQEIMDTVIKPALAFTPTTR